MGTQDPATYACLPSRVSMNPRSSQDQAPSWAWGCRGPRCHWARGVTPRITIMSLFSMTLPVSATLVRMWQVTGSTGNPGMQPPCQTTPHTRRGQPGQARRCRRHFCGKSHSRGLLLRPFLLTYRPIRSSPDPSSPGSFPGIQVPQQKRHRMETEEKGNSWGCEGGPW